MIPGRISLTPSDTVGEKYRIVKLIGRGGVGRVYEAENTVTERRVALKLLRANEEEGRSDCVPRFTQEARAASLVRHPNIVDVLDMGHDEKLDCPYMVLELLGGRSLASLLRATGGKLPVPDSLRIIEPIMEALIVAHERGVVHRDVKPDNLFLADTDDGVVPKLIDFGIAKVSVAGESLCHTRAGFLLGTPFYMSPEQCRGDASLDARSDVWSVGIVLYEMLAGRLPHSAPNTMMMLATILRDEPTPLSTYLPAAPSSLQHLVMKALSRDVDHRWPSMEAFRDALLDMRRELSRPSATSPTPAAASAHRRHDPLPCLAAITLNDVETSAAVTLERTLVEVERSVVISSRPPSPWRRVALEVTAAAAVALGLMGALALRAPSPATPRHATAATLVSATGPVVGVPETTATRQLGAPSRARAMDASVGIEANSAPVSPLQARPPAALRSVSGRAPGARRRVAPRVLRSSERIAPMVESASPFRVLE